MHTAQFTGSDTLSSEAIYLEMKICEQGTDGCLLTFQRSIGSRRVVCDSCLLTNIKRSQGEKFDRSQSPSAEERKDVAWSNVKHSEKMARNAAHIEVSCLRKFAYASFGAALRTANGRKTGRTHKNVRKMQPYRCEYQIHDSSDEARRGVHFHVGGDHEDFAGSAF